MVFIVAASFFFAGTAEKLPNTLDFTCAEVRAFIGQQGAVRMRTKSQRFSNRTFYALDQQCPPNTEQMRVIRSVKGGTCALFICEGLH